MIKVRAFRSGYRHNTVSIYVDCEDGNKVFSAGIAFTSLDRQDKVYLQEYLEQYNNG